MQPTAKLSYCTDAECRELVALFADIEDEAVRQKVINLVAALASDTAELVTLEELVTFQ
jgi:hypothetical protein